jgi:hypothetical protein
MLNKGRLHIGLYSMSSPGINGNPSTLQVPGTTQWGGRHRFPSLIGSFIQGLENLIIWVYVFVIIPLVCPHPSFRKMRNSRMIWHLHYYLCLLYLRMIYKIGPTNSRTIPSHILYLPRRGSQKNFRRYDIILKSFLLFRIKNISRCIQEDNKVIIL